MANKQKIKGAEALLLSLIEEGTDTIFGYPGGQVIPIYDHLYHFTDRINHILTRHEQGAVHAAQGYARATGKVGVCMATSGPGSDESGNGNCRRHARFDPAGLYYGTGSLFAVGYRCVSGGRHDQYDDADLEMELSGHASL